MNVVYDAGVLVAAERGDPWVWQDHKTRLERGVTPLVPATVVAQVSRSPRQAQLRRFLRGCTVTKIDEPVAHQAGHLLAASRSTDVVDATVVVVAAEQAAPIITGDVDDLERLARAGRLRVEVLPLQLAPRARARRR